MRGSIVKRNEKFYVVTDVAPGPSGKRRQKWHASYPTRKQAEKELRKILVELDEHRYVEPSARTLSTYLLEDWLPAMATTLRPSTLRIYRQVLTAYVLPALGRYRLADLDPLLLTKHYAALLALPKQRQAGTLSPRTVRYCHVVLKHALADAVLWRLLAHNPAVGARPPSANASRPPEMKTWSLEQLRAFLAGTAGTPEHAGYVLAAACGLRRGEVCGLRWDDVDLAPRSGPPVLRVRQQLVVDAAGNPAFTVPKTKASLRPVALDQGTVEVLRRHAFQQRVDRLAAGPAYVDSGLVIRRADGAPVNPTDWVALFLKHSKRLGLPHIRFHDLRHTHATLALQAGVAPEDHERAARAHQHLVHPRHRQPRGAEHASRCGCRRRGADLRLSAAEPSLQPHRKLTDAILESHEGTPWGP